MHVIHLMANNSSVPYFNWFADEVKNHPDLKFTFVALHSERPKMLDDMRERGSDCVWIKFDCSNRKPEMTKAFFKLYKLFRKLKPDVVHSHLFDDSLPAMLAAKLAGVKKRVITKQDTTFHWYYAPKWVWADKFNNQNATHLIAQTSENRDFILECEKADPKKVHLVHHGVPLKIATNQIEEVKEQFKAQYKLEDKIVVGTVCRLIEWKGYRYIIDAAEQAVKKYLNLHFLFVGRGDQKPELERLIAEKNLKNHITFTDWIDPQHIPSVYGTFDIYLHAAKFEPFGFVIAEAMMNAVPVVSTTTGAAKDAIVHKENGYLVDYNNMNDLANGIDFILNNDPKQIGEKGRKTALQMYQLETMFNNYKKLYFGK